MRRLILRGEVEKPNKAESASIDAMRLWTRAEFNPELFARLMAQETLMGYITSFHAGGKSRQIDVDTAGLTPEEILVLDAVAALYQRQIDEARRMVEHWSKEAKTVGKPRIIHP